MSVGVRPGGGDARKGGTLSTLVGNVGWRANSHAIDGVVVNERTLRRGSPAQEEGP